MTVWLVYRRFLIWNLLVGVYATEQLALGRCGCSDRYQLWCEERNVVGGRG